MLYYLHSAPENVTEKKSKKKKKHLLKISAMIKNIFQ